MYSYFSDVCNVLSNSTVNNVTVLYIIIKKKILQLPPFSLLRDFSFQNTSEHSVNHTLYGKCVMLPQLN